MGMRKLYQSAEQETRGTFTAYNAANHAISVKLYGHNGPLRPVVMKPGDEIELDAGYRRNLRAISPHLREGSSPRKPVVVEARESFPAAPWPQPEVAAVELPPIADDEPAESEPARPRKRGRPRKSDG